MSAWTCHQSEGKAAQKIVPPRLRTPCWKGPGADSEEKREPASDINIGAVDSLKVLDPKRPIREADMKCSERAFPLLTQLRHHGVASAAMHGPHVLYLVFVILCLKVGR